MSALTLRLSAGDGEDPVELDAFRAEVRAWIAEHVPADWRARMTGMSEEAYVAFQRGWMRELREAGYLAPHIAQRWGGGGLGLARQVILAEELARGGAPQLTVTSTALYHAASTLAAHGTEEQKARHIPAILDGEIWTQGFSEPNAGSDLASLQTRAVRDGDAYVVNGQKIWSSYAAHATSALLLARTDPGAPEAEGDHLLHPRHAAARRRDRPDRPEHRRGRVLRDLPDRRPRSRPPRCSARSTPAGAWPRARSRPSAACSCSSRSSGCA